MATAQSPRLCVSPAERTDLVEAIWRDLSSSLTTLVAFDFFLAFVLGTCAQLERSERGPAAARIRGVHLPMAAFQDRHTHPWFTRRFCVASQAGPPGSAAHSRCSSCGRGCGPSYKVQTPRFASSTRPERPRWPVLASPGQLARAITERKRPADSVPLQGLSRSFPSSWRPATKIPLKHQQVDLAQERLASSAFRSSAYPAVTHTMSSRKPWLR